jgi:hypothetical protein
MQFLEMEANLNNVSILYYLYSYIQYSSVWVVFLSFS